jgi:ketosteroid isomerase-like protein
MPRGERAVPNSVDIVREFWSQWAAGDERTAFALLHPVVRWVIPDVIPWGGCYIGSDGIRDYCERAARYIRDDTAVYAEYLGSGERVVDIGYWQATARSSGVRFRVPTVHVSTVQDGQIAEVSAYYDPGAVCRALED